MSWASYVKTLDASPALRAVTERVVSVLRSYPDFFKTDLSEIGHKSGLNDVELLAALNVLRTNDLGHFEVGVVDERGRVIDSWRTEEGIPGEVFDDYGDRVEVEPSKLRVLFLPHLESIPVVG